MKERKSRREFIALSSLAALNYELYGHGLSNQEIETKPIPADPSPDELNIIHNSKVAQDLVNFFGKGHSCAESGLAVCLRFLEKPEDLVWFAGGFGGGLGRGDLCGFLTSGIMAIGIYAGSLELERQQAKKICGELVKQYWDWWAKNAPLHCSEVRYGHQDGQVCTRLGYLAMAEIENLLTPNSANDQGSTQV